MKKKILIVIVVIWFLIGFVYFRFKKNDIEDNINNVEDIDISVSDDIIESVDFDSLKKYNIELTETLKITNGGVYTLSGNISDGQIYVDTKDSVKLILDNVNITNETGSTIMIENANVVYIELKKIV